MVFFETLRTYSEMRKVIDAFAAPSSALTFVIIKGDPGIGKTNSFRKEVKDAFIFECNTSPYGLYTALYENRLVDAIILDDVDNLWRSPVGINLLKSVCQTDRIKTPSWNTKAADHEGIPRSFITTARVLLFCNVLPGRGGNFEAVLDRGITYEFKPTALEVHSEVKGWIERKETVVPIFPVVFEFIGHHLEGIVKPTFRDYVKASQMEAVGLDWRTSLRARWAEDPKLVAAAEIFRLAQSGNPAYDTADKRAKVFESWGHGVRSTYMKYQKRVLEDHGLQRINSAKPATNKELGLQTVAICEKSESPREIQLPASPVVPT
jgi:hypothetical protein